MANRSAGTELHLLKRESVRWLLLLLELISECKVRVWMICQVVEWGVSDWLGSLESLWTDRWWENGI